jgi:hypothetical protein
MALSFVTVLVVHSRGSALMVSCMLSSLYCSPLCVIVYALPDSMIEEYVDSKENVLGSSPCPSEDGTSERGVPLESEREEEAREKVRDREKRSEYARSVKIHKRSRINHRLLFTHNTHHP